jgi:hypothetical protein
MNNHVIIISYNISEAVDDGIYQTGLREFFYHDYNDIFKAVIKESSEHDHVCIIDRDTYDNLPNHTFTTIRDNSINVWKGSNV